MQMSRKEYLHWFVGEHQTIHRLFAKFARWRKGRRAAVPALTNEYLGYRRAVARQCCSRSASAILQVVGKLLIGIPRESFLNRI